MKYIDLTFLGTGNAVPTELRNHSAILLNFEGEHFLFDCGEGTQRQFRKAKTSIHKISSIFITHWHGDHILGIPALLQTLAMTDYKKTLEIYGPRGTKRNMDEILNLIKGTEISLKVHEISSGKIIENKKYLIEAIELEHGTPALAYSFKVKDQIRLNKAKLKKFKIPNSPLIGKLQQGEDIIFNGKKIKASQLTYKEPGKKVSIVLDTKFCTNAIKISENSDLAIVESSFSEQEKDKAGERMHLTATQAATIAKKAKAKKLALTHISERYEHNISIIEKEAKKVFKNVFVAKDLQTLKV
ncbi:MAG: ribonuclease Z [Nanoarchaeota archaeon]